MSSVNFTANAVSDEVLFKRISLSIANDTKGVLVPDVFVVSIRHRENNPCPGGREFSVLGGGAFAMGGICENDAGEEHLAFLRSGKRWLGVA